MLVSHPAQVIGTRIVLFIQACVEKLSVKSGQRIVGAEHYFKMHDLVKVNYKIPHIVREIISEVRVCVLDPH